MNERNKMNTRSDIQIEIKNKGMRKLRNMYSTLSGYYKANLDFLFLPSILHQALIVILSYK